MAVDQFRPKAIIKFAAISLIVTACAGAQKQPNFAGDSAIQSLFSSLETKSCTETLYKKNTDDQSYLVCPGVAGYRLQVSSVDSGRLSINIVTPAKQVFPLSYEEFITRSMDDIDNKAEWRVRKENGKIIPIALIVRVLVHGNSDENVTSVFWAVAKVTRDRACVTDRIHEGYKPANEVRVLADSAVTRSCAARLPISAIDVH